MALRCDDRVIEGRVHSRPVLICEACHEELTDINDGHVYWTPFAESQVAYAHSRCRGAFREDLHHRELSVFVAQLLRTLRPEEGWKSA